MLRRRHWLAKKGEQSVGEVKQSLRERVVAIGAPAEDELQQRDGAEGEHRGVQRVLAKLYLVLGRLLPYPQGEKQHGAGL